MPAVPPSPRRHEWAGFGQLDAAQLEEWERRRLALRLWVPFALSLVVQLGTSFGIIAGHYFRHDLGQGHAAPLVPVVAIGAIVFAVAGPGALLLRRRWPGPIAAVTVALALGGAVLCVSRLDAVPLYLSVLFGLGGAVSHGARGWAWGSAAAAWFGAIAIMLATHARGIGVLVPITVLLVLAIAIPAVGRGRRERFVDAQRRVVQRQADAAQAERLRIARELHDVLAHSLSLINVQASVGLHLFEQQPEQAREALATIKDTSKSALAEVRQVLGVLRADGGASGPGAPAGAADDGAPLAPQPELASVSRLAAEAGAQGLEVELRGGIAEAPQAVQSALYRIVQEALTNVRKHAEAAHVVIELGETSNRYAVTVTDDGHGVRDGDVGLDAGAGSGLLGMRERAELLGGSFVAGPGVDGGFVVSARIPKADPA